MAGSTTEVSAGGQGRRLTMDELRGLVDEGQIDTVTVAFCDMQGRLQGKRYHARHFLDHVSGAAEVEPAEGCNYLLAVDVDMNTVDGYAMSSWEQGYGDFVIRHDPTTLRLVPWQPGTAMVQSDLEWHDGTPVVASPRQVLAGQIERLAERGLVAYAGTELEFLAFHTAYADAWRDAYRDMEPASRFNVDYALSGTPEAERLLRRIRNEMYAAGLPIESAKGECNDGQFEIAIRYADALTTADNHVVYKAGVKEIAAQEGMSVTFMPKFDDREGNSCHVHLSLRSVDGALVFASDETMSPLMEHFLAGQLASLRELTLLLAPNINSYKRFQPGSFAPTTVAWGHDNRTCALRVVGRGHSVRFENRVPGGDANPYLALAGLIAAGLHGIDNELMLESAFHGNAYEAEDRPRVPSTLRDAADAFAKSDVARSAFGDDVVDHYLNAARVELAAFDAAVTDWERFRGFERM